MGHIYMEYLRGLSITVLWAVQTLGSNKINCSVRVWKSYAIISFDNYLFFTSYVQNEFEFPREPKCWEPGVLQGELKWL